MGAWSRPWGRGQGFDRVVKAVGAWPTTWGLGQGCIGVAKAVEALTSP